ncbi:MAG: cytochrome c peroxidase [Hellea sp.]
MKHLILSSFALPLLVACGGSSSPIAPVAPTPPVVTENRAPSVVTPNPDQTAIVGIAFNYDATQSGTTFSDADGDTLTYSVEYNPGPQGLTDTAGVISGTPSMAGTIAVTIRVNDGNGREAIDVFDIVIAAAASGQSAIQAKFAGQIDMDNLANYAAQTAPAYIAAPITGGNPITDAGATLGRVLFYDPALSIDDTVSCSSCHVQSHGFSDPKLVSDGVEGGVTGRHSMRLINTAFSEEQNFFWDERASSLEDQTTQPIQDENEHGFSGVNGRPDIDVLIMKLESLDYYQELFTYAFGDANITEPRLQEALGQFVKSIQSFDSKFDIGRAQAANDRQNFPNFTADENAGKQLFMVEPGNGGAGCNTCHRAPEFDIRPNSRHNGVVGVANSVTEFDLTNTKAPSLRDLAKPGGAPNGPFMHDGSLATLLDVINHYDEIIATTSNPSSTEFQNTIDPFLNFNGMLQDLNLTDTEKAQMVAFLETLTGSNVYTDEKLSDPF